MMRYDTLYTVAVICSRYDTLDCGVVWRGQEQTNENAAYVDSLLQAMALFGLSMVCVRVFSLSLSRFIFRFLVCWC